MLNCIMWIVSKSVEVQFQLHYESKIALLKSLPTPTKPFQSHNIPHDILIYIPPAQYNGSAYVTRQASLQRSTKANSERNHEFNLW